MAEIPSTRACQFALTCLILAMTLWGNLYVMLRVALHELSPLQVILGRTTLDSLVFLVAWRRRGHIDYRSGDWRYLSGLVAREPCLYFPCEFFALQYTNVVQAEIIIVLLPLLVAVGAWLLLHERIGRMTWIGFGLAVLGSIQLGLTGKPGLHTSRPLLGNSFELLATPYATGYALLLEHLSARCSVFVLTAIRAFVDTLLSLPLALVSAGLPNQPSVLGIQAVVYLGVVVTVDAYGLYNFGVGQLPASRTSGLINLIPVFVLVFAALFFGGILDGPQMSAIGPVFIGIAINQRRSTPPPPPAGVLN